MSQKSKERQAREGDAGRAGGEQNLVAQCPSTEATDNEALKEECLK